ncbi:MAG: hypothetical protein AAGF54_14370 [Pseudomonadota bacterium]
MPNNLKNMISILCLVGLAACQSIPSERTSPCVCDLKPINQSTEQVTA